MAIDLNEYIDVAARIAEFRTKHPEGSLQPVNLAEPYRIEEISGVVYIVVVAAAYRSPDDARPGVGMAYEVFPGKTPYTRGSELQNAETSAWGRAIVAALAADTKKVASREEVRNRRAEQDEPLPPVEASPEVAAANSARSELRALCAQHGVDMHGVMQDFSRKGFGDLRTTTNVDSIRKLIEEIRKDYATSK